MIAQRRIALVSCVVVPTICWLFLAMFMHVYLGRAWLFADVPGYVEDSLNWRTPFRDVHVPGYPLLVALVRGLTLGLVPNLILMYAINYTAMLGCCAGLLRLGKTGLVGLPGTILVLGVFVLWPFVGLNAIVSPLAEVPAMAFFLWGLVFLFESRIWRASILFGLGMLCHKGLWPFVAFVILGEYAASRRTVGRELGMLAVTAGPLVILWILCAIHYGDPLWIVSTSLSMGAESRKAYVPFEGLWHTLSQDGLKGLVKGSVVLALIAFLGVCAVWSFRLRREVRWVALGIVASALFWFAFLTKLELLAAVRFSRLLVVIPVWYLAETTAVESKRRNQTGWVVALLLLLLVSQFAAAWHMHQKLCDEGIPLQYVRS